MVDLIPKMPLLISDDWMNVRFREVDNSGMMMNILAVCVQARKQSVFGNHMTVSGGYMLSTNFLEKE